MQFLLHHGLESHAAGPATRDREAFSDAQHSLNYSAANRFADQLANALAAGGVGAGDRVAIFMNRSVEACIAIFAILKIGAAYVPIDPKAPANRVFQILTTVAATAVVVDAQRGALLQKRPLPSSVKTVVGDSDTPWDSVRRGPDSPVDTTITEDDLAYVIFTSGSTGTPKGIMHTHRSGLAYARWAAAEYALQYTDRVASFSPFHFDISTFDLFAARLAGASTIIVPQGLQVFPKNCAKLLGQQKISIIFSVPHVFRLLAERGDLGDVDLTCLRWLIYGGEPYPADQVRHLMQQIPSTKVSNMYGPAEVNGVTAYHLESPPAGKNAIPIGPPAKNVEAILLDGSAHEIGGEGEGELAIRSPTRMQAYWDNSPPAESYLHHRTAPGGQLHHFYRTGDFVHRDPHGCLTFRGRRDHLVKVRGHRIELGEVELAISACPGVAYAACTVLGDLLVAAVESAPGHELTETAVLAALKPLLPPYATPGRVAIAAKMPRTSSDKIDRTRLHTLFS